MRQAVAMNGLTNVEIVEAAVAAESGEGLNPLQGSVAKNHSLNGEGHTIPVATVSLDDLFARFGRPDLVKMDIEGSERPVLEACNELLAAGTTFVIEPHSPHAVEGVTARLLSQQYRVDDSGWWILASPG